MNQGARNDASAPIGHPGTEQLADWVKRAMRFIDLCDADAAGYDELHDDAEKLILQGFRLFGLDAETDDNLSLADLEYLSLKPG